MRYFVGGQEEQGEEEKDESILAVDFLLNVLQEKSLKRQEEVEEGCVCGQTTEFVLAKLHQTVSFTEHSLNPPR